jgi:cob(I)alamin adenosyltransferase
MSIATRTGDKGTSALMYGRRVPKNHMRVESYGAVDELNAELGLARASASDQFIKDNLLKIQKDLVAIMGELATVPEDQERYSNDGYPGFDVTMLTCLDELVSKIESKDISFHGWATPGATISSATLDVCRTVCRRAERRISELHLTDELPDEKVLAYFNRLSDVLWLMARWVETREDAARTS